LPWQAFELTQSVISGENHQMSTKTRESEIPPEVLADQAAVIKRLIDGTPIDPEVSRRIDERADRITEELRRKYGAIDVVQLLRSARDEV
jgi:hypothetical protein